MFKHGEISTETDRGPFLFTLAAFIVSAVTAILLFVLGKGSGLAIFAGVLVSIVAAAALPVLIAILTDRAYIENGALHTSYLFKKADIPFDSIEKVTYRDSVYYVHGKRGEVLATINGKLTGIGAILKELEKNGVCFE